MAAFTNLLPFEIESLYLNPRSSLRIFSLRDSFIFLLSLERSLIEVEINLVFGWLTLEASQIVSSSNVYLQAFQNLNFKTFKKQNHLTASS